MLRMTNYGVWVDDDGTLNENEKAMLYIKECAESVGIEVIYGETAFSIPFMARVMRGLREKEPKTEWIPVSERLPEDGERVLVWYQYWRFGEYNNWFQTYGIGYVIDDRWSVIDGGIKTTVFAWLPLPEPYKEG